MEKLESHRENKIEINDQNFDCKIFGVPTGFDLSHGSNDDNYFYQMYYDGNKEEKTFNLIQSGGKMRYIYKKNNLFDGGSGRPGAFLGIALEFNGIYCQDIDKLYDLIDTIFEKIILEKKYFISGKNFNITTFKGQEDKIKEIKDIIKKNLNTHLSNEIKKIDENFNKIILPNKHYQMEIKKPTIEEPADSLDVPETTMEKSSDDKEPVEAQIKTEKENSEEKGVDMDWVLESLKSILLDAPGGVDKKNYLKEKMTEDYGEELSEMIIENLPDNFFKGKELLKNAEYESKKEDIERKRQEKLKENAMRFEKFIDEDGSKKRLEMIPTQRRLIQDLLNKIETSSKEEWGRWMNSSKLDELAESFRENDIGGEWDTLISGNPDSIKVVKDKLENFYTLDIYDRLNAFNIEKINEKFNLELEELKKQYNEN